MCPRVLFSPSLFSLLLFSLSSPVAGESGCCHEVLFLCRLINMFSVFFSPPLLSFSLSEEKTQLVLNVDKQLEEVRELVRLWSVISSSSHFLNNEFVQRGRRQFALAPDNSTCVLLLVTWHDADARVAARRVSLLLAWSLSCNVLLSDTPMTHFKPLSWGGSRHVAILKKMSRVTWQRQIVVASVSLCHAD